MDRPSRIKYNGQVYLKVADSPYGSPTQPATQFGRGNGNKQKALQPAVKRVMPSNPDPLFDKAFKVLEKMETLIESSALDTKDLDFKLLVKRYNLPSLRLLLAEWDDFNLRLKGRVKRVMKEMRAARGQSEEF